MTSAVLPSYDLAARTGAALSELRARTPLVQCVTNEVTSNLVANAVLAIGASPAMASVPGEAEELAGSAGAVLVNLGTPGPDQRACVEATVAAAVGAGVPWVLDPVAVGVLSVRTRLAARLLAERPTVVRGNASEVRALAGEASSGRGVDARDAVEAAASAARALAGATGGAVAVSGPVDLVTDGSATLRLAVGDPFLARVTGAGCALGGLTAAFAAVTDPVVAAVGASTALGVAAERAAVVARGPGSFVVALLDELSLLSADDVAARVGAELAVGVPA
ncbi:hydroxyethylthiazole kinase [Cellulomonas oligotrophica]|uniref:Hydroxyethylthiazole kinase n=1 Tax=Cellulomonas oligotrophica TaxID=931536 RepID=A0A7Y9FBW5_9CELL|nr:hydroxyethylthiazole kinase [Cellulomonas oligotrophica]NYD84489.1 hydroxyethylthiazole kinase [Cellulomonas oligotrophica]GIG33869.1 hydroxyethylthiazole kinase [Cellulomonas oligotrophica]